MKPSLLPLALCAVTLLPQSAQAAVFRDLAALDFSKAEQQLGAGGLAVKVLFPRGGKSFVMAGGGGTGYLTENFYVGGAGYGGTLVGGNGGLGYGGFLSGYECKHSGLTHDFSLLVGGGGGGMNLKDNSQGAGSFVFEPAFAIKKSLGGGAKVALQASYLYFPSIEDLSGPALGLKLEFKTLTFSFPIDD